MSAEKTLIDKCEELVEVLENTISNADSYEMFEMVKAGLEADVEPQDVVEAVINYYCFGTPLSWSK